MTRTEPQLTVRAARQLLSQLLGEPLDTKIEECMDGDRHDPSWSMRAKYPACAEDIPNYLEALARIRFVSSLETVTRTDSNVYDVAWRITQAGRTWLSHSSAPLPDLRGDESTGMDPTDSQTSGKGA